jgi:NAD(P)-dependent dehydrogenase (short-subunit alcohol dehydrogenase family)
VAVHYRQERQQAEELAHLIGHNSMSFQADLSKPQEVINLYEQVITQYGRMDLLINNAGVAHSTDIAEHDEQWIADWAHTFSVNTQAQGILCKKAIATFKIQGGGRIINVASRAAFRGDTPDYLAYGASKGAIPALTRSIARYFGKENIKAFCIAPGFVRTDMAQDFMDQYGEAYALNDIALNQLTEPKDLAPMVVFLASGLADHATGTTIDINAASYVR